MPDSIGILGPGRLGQAMGRLLFRLGQPVVAVAGRDFSRTEAAAKFIGAGVKAVDSRTLPERAGRILVTVPDDALPFAAAELAASAKPPAIALHTSGARGPEALEALIAQGSSCGAPSETSCGTLHPMQTIASREQGVADLPGSYFGITASGSGLDWALEICGLLNGHALLISAEDRPLYHAAAVLASNSIMTLIDAAVTLLRQTGVSEDDALRALAPMIRASVANSLAMGPAKALTGPIERGDVQTIAAHLEALARGPASVRDLYRSAGLHTVAVARRKSPGVDRDTIVSLLEKERLKRELSHE